MTHSRKLLLQRIERSLNRYRNAVEGRFDGRIMKSARLSETTFNWGYRDMAMGVLYDAGEALKPPTLRYRRDRILRKLSKKYVDALDVPPTIWVRLNESEREAFIEENALHSQLKKSFETNALRYNAQTKTIHLKMTLAQRRALYQKRKIAQLLRKVEKLIPRAQNTLRKDPSLFNDYPWDLVYQWQIDKYI